MEEKLLEQFADYISTSREDLSWRSPKTEKDLWVFWTEEKTSNHTLTNSDHHISIQDRVKSALFAMDSYGLNGDVHVLIQYWAATTTMTDEGGRRFLTTSDQPYALSRLTNEKLNQYKKNCPNYKYVDQREEEHNLTDGSIGRVFRWQLPEMSQDVSYYSIKEYPERDLALGCDIKSTLALPVFEPSLQCCVGALELLFTECNSLEFNLFARRAIRAVQVAGLETVNPLKSQNVEYSPSMGELKLAMHHIVEKHGLPLAKIWARCKHISSVDRGGCLSKRYNDYDVNCRGEFLVSNPYMYVIDLVFSDYDYFLHWDYHLPLRVGDSPVGKVFHSDKPCFCRDVTQLSIIDYPMAHFVRQSRFKSCLAACLQSVATKNRVFAVEFFLPPNKIHRGDFHNFLSSILTTLKQHLKSFEVVTGDIENDFCTEIDILTEYNVEASVVKGNNVVRAEQGNTSFTHNTLNTSCGHETRSPSGQLTSFHTISSLREPSGHETTISSGQLTSFHTISSLSESSGHETTSSSGQLTSFHTISSLSKSSGHETASSSEQLTSSHTISSLSKSSGHDTTSSSGQLTSFHTISSLSKSSGHETTSSSGKLISSLGTSSGHETTSSSGQLTAAAESTHNSICKKQKLNIYSSPSSNKSNLYQSTSIINDAMDSDDCKQEPSS